MSCLGGNPGWAGAVERGGGGDDGHDESTAAGGRRSRSATAAAVTVAAAGVGGAAVASGMMVTEAGAGGAGGGGAAVGIGARLAELCQEDKAKVARLMQVRRWYAGCRLPHMFDPAAALFASPPTYPLRRAASALLVSRSFPRHPKKTEQRLPVRSPYPALRSVRRVELRLSVRSSYIRLLGVIRAHPLLVHSSYMRSRG